MIILNKYLNNILFKSLLKSVYPWMIYLILMNSNKHFFIKIINIFKNEYMKWIYEISTHKKLKLSSIKEINYYLSLIFFYSYINFLINSPYGLFLNYTAKNDS